MRCLGCGAPANPENPQPTRCQQCQPERCEKCGRMDHVTAPCMCWTSLSGLPLADVNGLLARGGLSLRIEQP